MISPALLFLAVIFHLLTGLTTRSFALPSVPNDNFDGRNGGQKVRNGAVVSEVDFCSDIGGDMLKKGGNAADAIVATAFCVGVAGMFHSGLGGGGFALVRTPEGKLEFVDFRETAPAAAHEEMFVNKTEAAVRGGLASGVPGQARGLEYLHETYGSLSWSAVIEPSIRASRDGFKVPEDLAVRFTPDREFLTKDPAWAMDFAPNGKTLEVGDIITQRRLADTLETIAKSGADAFYVGPIAEATVNALRKSDGIMTTDDLANYKVEVREALEIDYRGFKVASTTAPSSGPITLSILNILDEYNDFYASGTVNLSTHRLDEAMRFAYGQRTEFGDPAYVKGLEAFEREILTPETAARIRSKISDERTYTNISAYDPIGYESLDTPGTSHMSAIDSSGLAISLTSTINLIFGSELIVPETGVIMNNEMDDFSIPGSSNQFGYIPSPSNYAKPGKRMLSSMCPAIVYHPSSGETYLVTGAAGGSRIITSTALSIINVVDRGMNAPDAVAAPRQHDQLVPQQVAFEWAFDNSTTAFMKERGHNVTWVGPGQSAVQAIRVLDSKNGNKPVYEVAPEPRQKNSGGTVV